MNSNPNQSQAFGFQTGSSTDKGSLKMKLANLEVSAIINAWYLVYYMNRTRNDTVETFHDK